MKPQNVGFTVKKGKVKAEYIDLGSATWDVSTEPENASESIYPSTLLYVSNNKVPDINSNLFEYIENEKDEMIDELTEEYSLIITMKTTCKKAKPNHKWGVGDNAWAKAITILECIYGQHPALFDGLELEVILETIRTEDFYARFIKSEVYEKFYKGDEDFEPVRKFLEGALNQDCEKREYHVFNNENIAMMIEKLPAPSNLKKDLSEHYDL